VLAELRLSSIDDLREVRLATVENDGRISVLKEEWADELRKGDVLKELREAKTDAPGDDGPPERVRTDSPDALGLRG
jgi:uncharacterized membrane protein YcaP (DUF421 family)